MPLITNIAAYKFARLTDLQPWRDRLLSLCKQWRLKGTILLSTEGINLFVAGGGSEIELLLAELRLVRGLESLEPKISQSEEQPFRRLLIKIKAEIISFGVEGIDPAEHPAPKLSPQELKQWLDEGRPITLLDTRNDYEVRLGTFEHALQLNIDHFREFPQAVQQLPETLKQQPIVMFCTGGIRCEKAGPFMQQQGFENIFQLDGGILKYFEDCGGDHYQGECFVFDQRVGVDPSLHESETTQCFACQSPLTPAQQLSDLYVAGKSCPYCFVPTDEQQRQTIAKRHLAIRRVTTPLPGSIPYENQRPLNVPREYDGLNLLDFLCKILGHVPRDEWQRACNDGRLRKRLRQLPRNKRPQPGSLENSAQRPKSRNLRPRQHQELNPANDVFELSSQKFVEVESMAVVTEDEIVRSGDRLIHVQEMKSEPEISSDIRILYEDEAVIVIHKPAPLPMHPSGRFNRNTLQQILSEVYNPQSPRPAHRLDANTAGLVLFTRTKHFAKVLQSQFELPPPEGIEKRYLARIHGHPQQDSFSSTRSISVQAGPLGSRTVDDLDGLPAHTDFRVLNRFPDGTSLLEVVPRTGRTNQIRVHLWHLHLPICGDATYRTDGQLGESQTLSINEPPLCLLAQRITFTHPLTRQRMTFEAERPTWAFDSLSK